MAVLDEWYRRDDNSLPPTYVLSNVQDKLPEILSVGYICIKTLRKFLNLITIYIPKTSIAILTVK